MFFALTLFFQLETLLVPPRHDSAVWLFMAQRQTHGQMPGRDLWDNKLPPIYLIGRAALATEHPQVFLWLFEAALTALATYALFRLVAGIVDRRAAWLAAILLCVVSGAPGFHAGGYSTEIYALPLSVLAFAASWHSGRHAGRIASGLAGGFAWTLAVAFRLPLAPAAVAVVTCLCLQMPRPAGPPRALGPHMRFITAHALGAFLAGMAVLAHPFAADYLADCLASAVAWPLNVDGKRIPGPLTPTTLERLADAGQDIARLGWLHIAAILGLALTLNKPTAPAVVRNLAAVTGVWYVAAMASSLMGWASYAHYQYVAFAPLAISAGLFAWSLPLRFQRWAPIALLIVTIAANSAQAARTILRDRARDDGPKAALVSHIRSQTAPSDTVFFWIGGSDADLMHRADRPPGLRHFLAASCFNMDMRLFSEFANEFLARPPDWIVEDRNLNRPSLREPGRYDWEARVPDLARLQRFVQRAYAPVATFGDFELLRRRDLLSFDGLQ